MKCKNCLPNCPILGYDKFGDKKYWSHDSKRHDSKCKCKNPEPKFLQEEAKS